MSAEDRTQALADWWTELTQDDIARTMPKVREYSAHDLRLTGDLFEFFLDSAGGSPVAESELTCWFYLAGKLMRGIGALKDGERPSEDTIRDIRVYAAMITRIREVGDWPGGDRG